MTKRVSDAQKSPGGEVMRRDLLGNNVCRNNTQCGICMTGDASGNPSNGKIHHSTAISNGTNVFAGGQASS